MARNYRRRSGVGSIYSFAIAWLLLSSILPMYRVWALLVTLGACSFVSYLVGKAAGRKNAGADAQAAQAQAQAQAQAAAQQARPASRPAAAKKKSYGPEVDPIIEEGNKALSEMGRLYMSIQDTEVRSKINEIMRVT
ncbi:MAG: hypothetical protein IJ594_06560, partial [Oscillospiraceae bacterium]|nr:hypothetical protein [Oscillospiraceae bacterium]